MFKTYDLMTSTVPVHALGEAQRDGAFACDAGCSRCSGCSGCTGCTACTGCSDCSAASGPCSAGPHPLPQISAANVAALKVELQQSAL